MVTASTSVLLQPDLGHFVIGILILQESCRVEILSSEKWRVINNLRITWEL